MIFLFKFSLFENVFYPKHFKVSRESAICKDVSDQKKNISKSLDAALNCGSGVVFFSKFGKHKVLVNLKNFFSLSNNCFFIINYDKQLFIISSTLKFLSFFYFLFNIFLGLSRKFKARLYLVGLRVRIEKIYKKSIVLKLNLSHKVRWFCAGINFFKFKKIKNAFFIRSVNFNLINTFLSLIRKFKFPDIYKGNGIRFYKEKLKFKKRKQFGVF